ncbi:MAG: phosphoglycerate kinase [Spirochaetia bacterium]|nr:phosphoglycerate kinase [Spirochaetia bacterium]
MQRIENLGVEDSRVFVRADLAGFLEEGKMEVRISRILPVLDFLIQKRSIVILARHDSPRNGFLPIADQLSKSLGQKVIFTELAGLKDAVASATPGQVVLIENLLKYEGEAKNEHAFAEQLWAVTDIYVSDSFGALAQSYASILRHPRNKPVAIGPRLHDILTTLQHIQTGKAKPFNLILGGNDFSKKADMIAKLLRPASSALIGGSLAYTFMKSRLMNVGNSIVDVQNEVAAFQLQEKAELEQTDFLLPVDHIAAERFSKDAKNKSTRDIPDRWMGLDIGPKTVALFEKVLKGSGSVLWYGPLGAVDFPAFSGGSRAVMKILSKVKAPIVLLGNDTVRLGEEFTFENAVLIPDGPVASAYLSGKHLPGMDILQKEV